MPTNELWTFEPQANSGFCVMPAKERYALLADLIDKGMAKSEAIRAFRGIHRPDKQHEEYLKKLKEY